MNENKPKQKNENICRNTTNCAVGEDFILRESFLVS